jgi:hypothetical protein
LVFQLLDVIAKAEMARRTQASSLVQPTDHGLHLLNSILWFDASSSDEISFLSSASTKSKPKAKQILATEETLEILKILRRKPANALVCQYNRPFSIGRQKLELLPSGSILGGASLYVESDKERILYAPEIQVQKIPTVRQVQLKRAQTLILHANHPDPGASLPTRRRERERLLDHVQKLLSSSQLPIVMAEATSTAIEISKLFTDNGIAVDLHPTIYQIAKIYEAYGSPLGQYHQFKSTAPRERALIFPLMRSKQSVTALPEGPLVPVFSTAEESAEGGPLRSMDHKFYLSTSCDGAELREVISLVGPRQVLFFGPYARRYEQEFSTAAIPMRGLFENGQPTLF